MILKEQDVKQTQIIEIGKRMLIAARTAPKAKGLDHLEGILVYGDDLNVLANFMESGVQRHGRLFFLRDAGNIRIAEAVVVLGARQAVMNLNCGYCGFPTCVAKENAGVQFPCAFPLTDLGIALGSACAVAADSRVDTRVMFSAGVAAMELGWFDSDVKVAFAIPISAASKNPFFDRIATKQ